MVAPPAPVPAVPPLRLPPLPPPPAPFEDEWAAPLARWDWTRAACARARQRVTVLTSLCVGAAVIAVVLTVLFAPAEAAEVWTSEHSPAPMVGIIARAVACAMATSAWTAAVIAGASAMMVTAAVEAAAGDQHQHLASLRTGAMGAHQRVLAAHAREVARAEQTRRGIRVAHAQLVRDASLAAARATIQAQAERREAAISTEEFERRDRAARADRNIRLGRAERPDRYR